MWTSGIAAISYYAIFFPLITTIAHLSAGISPRKPVLLMSLWCKLYWKSRFYCNNKFFNSVLVGTILVSILLATENMKICQEKEGWQMIIRTFLVGWWQESNWKKGVVAVKWAKCSVDRWAVSAWDLRGIQVSLNPAAKSGFSSVCPVSSDQ